MDLPLFKRQHIFVLKSLFSSKNYVLIVVLAFLFVWVSLVEFGFFLQFSSGIGWMAALRLVVNGLCPSGDP